MNQHLFSEHSFDSFVKQYIRESENILLERLPGSSMKAYMIAKLYNESGKNVLVITGEGIEESKLKDDIAFFINKPVLEFPSWETLPSEKILPSKEIVGVRQKTLKILAEKSSSSEPVVVITSLQSTLQRVPAKAKIVQGTLSLRVGGGQSFENLIQRLSRLGYIKSPLTVTRGEYSIRGGIIDVFSVTHDFPYRIEFFGDEIDSIRTYDPTSQKALEEVPFVEISHALENLSEDSFDIEGEKESLFSLMGENETIVVLDDIEKIEDRYASLSGYNALVQKEVGVEENSSQAPHHNIVMSLKEWLHSIQKMSSWVMITEKNLEELTEEIAREKKTRSSMNQPEHISFSLFECRWKSVRIPHPLETLGMFYMSECLYDSQPQGESLLDGFAQTALTTHHTFVIQSEVEKEWIQTKLKDRGTSFEAAQIVKGYLSSGFARRDTKELFVPMSELIGRVKMKKVSDGGGRSSSSQSRAQPVTGFDAYELEPQDSVVHFHHGIGKFLGIEKRQNAQGVEQEFFLIEYAENSKLYVPLHQAHLITKYIGAKDESPRLHALGTSRWKKLREDTEKAIVGYASELLKAHAQREIVGGLEYPNDGPKMILFEAEFPYQETEDQLTAIDDIKKDMCSPKAMDRLVCGDVGYGKTEVAMRAAFKAVTDGKKQVAILVPTTVLAMQHYENFVERMTAFGIRIGILSRFQTTKQNKETMSKVSLGEIDILVGTHKLLQKDISFHDLGLVIIDEEQRFGVKAKEHLKIMKSGVDCLTLSATPIPRTLYMSLVGAKDLSTIATPPYDRLPIKTVVMEFDATTLQAAILREINRGGQVFYIHNRVETIFQACERVQKLVPRARVTAVHGQMDSEEIDLVFHAFKRGDIDILVATSIIENGIDMPNANTIIVERADLFGVAELYQLRGRVGRSNKRAFAYFIIPSQRALSEISRKRIQAIAQSGGYGGGLKVAMRDLEIRGAGDILGTEQSGHVASIGFHLYCKLLKRTVDTIQGKKLSLTYDTKIEVPYLAKLPEWYVNEVSLRVEIYQRLGDSESIDEIEAITKEMLDRFGPLPPEAEWLISVSRIRTMAASKGVTLVKIEGHTLTIERKRGKEQVTHQILIPKFKSPKEFYEKLHSILSTGLK